MTLATLLLLIAFVLFVLGAFGATRPNVNWISAGLACWALSALLGSGLFG